MYTSKLYCNQAIIQSKIGNFEIVKNKKYNIIVTLTKYEYKSIYLNYIITKNRAQNRRLSL